MRALPWLSVLFLSACGSGATGTSLHVAMVDTLPGGVVRVTNSGPTAWADTSGWRLVQERVIEPAEGSPGEIGKARLVVADSAGTIFLQETDPVRIKVYGADGEWIRNIGREGDGPGEFRDGMFTIASGMLVIQDPNNTRMTTFRTNGDFVGSSLSQCCWWTSKFPAFTDGTIGILGPPPPSAKDHQGALFVTRVADGVVVDTVLLPARNPGQDFPGTWTIRRTTPNGSSMMGISIPLQPTDPEAYFPTRQRITGNTGTYTLAITGLHRDTLRLFSAPAPTISITTAQRDSIYEDAVTNVSESWREAMRSIAKTSDIPTTWPRWSDVLVDGAARIWVSRPGAHGATSILDVFSPDGVLLGSVPVPNEKIMEGYWTADHVYLLDENTAGLPRILVYRIETKMKG